MHSPFSVNGRCQVVCTCDHEPERIFLLVLVTVVIVTKTSTILPHYIHNLQGLSFLSHTNFHPQTLSIVDLANKSCFMY